MKKTLQQIEDSYVSLGYKGEKLRHALEEDTEYQHLLELKKKKLTKKFDVSNKERTRYVLSTDTDFVILAKCKSLEKQDISTADRELVGLIRTQLEDDWRTPLVNTLNQLIKKYL